MIGGSGPDEASDVPVAAPQPLSLLVTQQFSRLTAARLWELVWRPSVQRTWLGEGSVVSLHADQRFSINLGGSLWRTGRVVQIRPGFFRAQMSPQSNLAGSAPTELVVAISEYATVCTLSITEDGFDDAGARQEAHTYWSDALRRLASVAGAADARLRSPRQAVIVIHGIGEQQPGRTLRDFVRAGALGASKETKVRPDRASRLFDLRRITMKAQPKKGLPTTDAFELYWAHLVRDTTIAQVLTWARRLMMRRHAPRPLRPALTTVYVIAAVVALLFAAQFVVQSAWFTIGSVVAAGAGLVWRLAGRSLAIDWIGDAARYLAAEPGNIAHRQEIRQEGVDLLVRLHEGGAYDRIVVVGHSLGSVIAYDIVTNAWIRMHSSHRSPSAATFHATRAVERALADDHVTPREAQELQHAAWVEQRGNTQPWLVTDLVTVGSPLTYGGFLMADSDSAFDTAKADRVLPTCPPLSTPERKSNQSRCSFELPYADSRGLHRTFTVFDHGAPFAVTRWTNLYFPVRWGGLKGDLVGGPLRDQFGRWVLDIPLPPVRGVAHTSYWKPPAAERVPPPPLGEIGASEPGRTDRPSRLLAGTLNHLASLRLAIDPWSRGELLALGRDLPLWLWSENRAGPR